VLRVEGREIMGRGVRCTAAATYRPLM
jgi:hypothetical protein